MEDMKEVKTEMSLIYHDTNPKTSCTFNETNHSKRLLKKTYIYICSPPPPPKIYLFDILGGGVYIYCHQVWNLSPHKNKCQMPLKVGIQWLGSHLPNTWKRKIIGQNDAEKMTPLLGKSWLHICWKFGFLGGPTQPLPIY